MIFVILVFGLLVVSGCGKEDYPKPICSYNAYNCDDLPTKAEAQYVFEECGGLANDVHHLDGDGDGLACEWNS